MNENKQALQVAALRDGTVIDHIPSEKLFTIVRLLGLEHMTNNITIGFNLESKKLGRKGIIKIAGKFFCDEEINRGGGGGDGLGRWRGSSGETQHDAGL